jgi:hypothetical protein
MARDPGAILADLNVPWMTQGQCVTTNAVILRKRGDSRVEIGEPRGEVAAASSYTGTTVQPLGCRNRINNGCGIGASFPAVSTWIAGLSQAGLISERRPSFLKTSSAFELLDLQRCWYAASAVLDLKSAGSNRLVGADLLPESDRDRKPPACAGVSSVYSRGQLTC